MKTLVIAASALTLASAVNAQGLTGISGARVVVESLDEDARLCGLTVDGLDAAARIVLSNSRMNLLKDSDSLPLPYFYIRVTVMRASDTYCVGSVETSFNRLVFVDASGTAKALAWGGMWRKGSLLGGSRSDFGNRVSSNVEALTKQFVGAWLKDN